MGQKPRALDPRASPAALFGVELRALRVRRGFSLAGLGRIVHVSGDLLSKVEKAERRPRSDLVARLDRALGAEGALLRAVAELAADSVPDEVRESIQLAPGDAVPVLRAVVDRVRNSDHAMDPGGDL